MGRSRRVTLRCATEDLLSGWNTPADLVNVRQLRELAQKAVIGDATESAVGKQLRSLPVLAALRHPLIQAFDDQFSGEDDTGTLRESISAVTDRQWLKQTYSSRWRGAAVIIDDEGSETAWLGAAGYHRAGSPEDFYEEFARGCRSGSDAFLPAAEDLKVREVEKKVARREAWTLQLHLAALTLLSTALDNPEQTYSATVRTPDEIDLLILSMTVVDTDVNGTIARELIVDLTPVDWERPEFCLRAAVIVKTAIDPQSETWTSAPLQNNAESHWTVLTEESIAKVRATAAAGSITADARPGEVRLGTIAHYTHREQIAYASVHGEAVRAMCGYWFVPTSDHADKPRCGTCQEEYEKTPV